MADPQKRGLDLVFICWSPGENRKQRVELVFEGNVECSSRRRLWSVLEGSCFSCFQDKSYLMAA